MRRPTVVVVAVITSTFFIGFGGGVIFPILPNLGTVLGFSPLIVGIILSANRFTRVLASVPAGPLVDRIGTRRPFVLGLAIEAVATTGYVVAVQAPFPEGWFLVSRIFWGAGSALVFATAYTIAADISDGRSVGMNMGVVRGGITLGFPAGLVLGGIVSDVYSVRAAFVLAATFAFAATGIAYLTIPETHRTVTEATVKPWEIDTSVPALTVGSVNFGLSFAYLGALIATLVLFVDARSISIWGYGPQGMSGLLMALTVVTATVFMLGGGRFSDRHGVRVPTLLVFLVVSLSGFVLLAVADTLPVLVASCVLIGAGQGGTSGPMMALLADLTPSERMGRSMATNNILGDLGGGLGPVVALPLVAAIGFSPVYGACAVIPLIAGVGLVAGVYVETGEVSPRTGEVLDE